MKVKDVTVLQLIGIIILFNTSLLGGASQLGDLFPSNPYLVKAALALATLGNGFLGGLVTMFGGLQAQKNAVGASGAIVVTSPASADALPNNPNVVAATAENLRALGVR